MNVITYTKAEAVILLLEGTVDAMKLPEWLGYWFNDNGVIKSKTRQGVIRDAWTDKYEDRSDWVQVFPETTDAINGI